MQIQENRRKKALMNKRRKSLFFSFAGTILTLAVGSSVGNRMGAVPELVVIITGLAVTLIIGILINKPDKKNEDSSSPKSQTDNGRKE